MSLCRCGFEEEEPRAEQYRFVKCIRNLQFVDPSDKKFPQATTQLPAEPAHIRRNFQQGEVSSALGWPVMISVGPGTPRGTLLSGRVARIRKRIGFGLAGLAGRGLGSKPLSREWKKGVSGLEMPAATVVANGKSSLGTGRKRKGRESVKRWNETSIDTNTEF